MPSLRLLVALLVALVVLVSVPARSGAAWGAVPTRMLSAVDRSVGAHAATLAGRTPRVALTWLRGQRDASSAVLGRDGQTIVIRFRDGARVVILPRGSHQVAARPAIRPHAIPHASVPPNGRAVVLEPFGTELDQGPTAGNVEAASLRQAGYQVDVLRNSQVTIPVMLGLAQYSFVYWNTHSGVLDNGDVVVVTGETSKPGEYAQYYQDKSLVQAFVAGDPAMTLYNGITGKFIDSYVGQFPAHTTWFLNGCRGLDGTTFWSDLQAKNVDALIGWHEQAQTAVDDRTGQFVMMRLARGDSVDAAIKTALEDGYGFGSENGTIATIGYRGDGSITMAESLTGVPPTPTLVPTNTPTPSPVPTVTPTRVPKPAKLFLRISLARHTVFPGSKQTVKVRTGAYASIAITVRFPNRATKTHNGKANAKGMLRWSYAQPRGTTTKKSHTVKVSVRVKSASGASNGATKGYTTR